MVPKGVCVLAHVPCDCFLEEWPPPSSTSIMRACTHHTSQQDVCHPPTLPPSRTTRLQTVARKPGDTVVPPPRQLLPAAQAAAPLFPIHSFHTVGDTTPSHPPQPTHTHTQPTHRRMIKSSSASSATSSTWSLALPPQFALLLGNLLVLANFITALLVPWAEARYKIIDAWFPVYVPVKIGYVRLLCRLLLCLVQTFPPSSTSSIHPPTHPTHPPTHPPTRLTHLTQSAQMLLGRVLGAERRPTPEPKRPQGQERRWQQFAPAHPWVGPHGRRRRRRRAGGRRRRRGQGVV